MKSNQVVAVILGGGAGSRLYPLTATRSKPAVPIAGKYRLVDIPISNCINSNISRIFVLTQYNSASLNKHIKNTYQFSGFSTGFVDILAAEQTPDSPGWFQGTADAVRQSLKHIKNNEFDYVLILSGDQLYQMDFADMIDHHQASGSDISIASIPVTEKDASDFGILKKDESNRISSFVEKPSKSLLPNWTSDTGADMKEQGRVYLASMGIYIFNRKVLFNILNEEKKEATDFGKEIIPESLTQYNVGSYQFDGYWTDIGNISSFFDANLALTQDMPPFNLFDDKRNIYTRARLLPPSKISGTTLEQTIIAEGTIIHAEKILNSVVGVRSRIGKGTVISSCYIMGSDFYETIEEIEYNLQHGIPKVGIGENCNLHQVILDKDCRVGNNVNIKGGSHLTDTDHSLFTIKYGIVVIKKGVIINDGFEI
jgi:glucose-1-phosphate adenylyltransferase